MSGSTTTRDANRERLLSRIPSGWRAAIHDATASDAFGDLADQLAEQWSRPDIEIYPPEHQVFRALELTPLREVRAVILGQDPGLGVLVHKHVGCTLQSRSSKSGSGA